VIECKCVAGAVRSNLKTIQSKVIQQCDAGQRLRLMGRRRWWWRSASCL